MKTIHRLEIVVAESDYDCATGLLALEVPFGWEEQSLPTGATRFRVHCEQKDFLERLQQLLAKAENMEDIISLESPIADTELNIEYLTGTLRKYDALVDYATVEITLEEVYVLSEQEQPVTGFWPRLAQAFSTGTARFVDNVQDFALGFARNWVGSLIWLAVIAAVIVLLVRWLRKGKKPPFSRRKKKTPAPPPAEGSGEAHK